MAYVVGLCVIAKMASRHFRRKNEEIARLNQLDHSIPIKRVPTDHSVIARVM